MGKNHRKNGMVKLSISFMLFQNYEYAYFEILPSESANCFECLFSLYLIVRRNWRMWHNKLRIIFHSYRMGWQLSDCGCCH